MEELIFFGIIILFSILDAIAKSKKKKNARPEGIPEPEWESSEAWMEEGLAMYDEEPPSEQGALSGEGAAGTSLDPYQGAGLPEELSPQRVVPADVWAEIEALARGESAAVEPEPIEVPARRVESRPPRPDHRVHRAHSEYGTDPSSRTKSEQDDLDPLKETLGADARKARRLLRATDAHSLRQAIILQEVLSPPVTLRDE